MASSNAGKTQKSAAEKVAETVEENFKTVTAQAEAVMEQFELPKSMREFAERSLEQSRNAYGRMRDAAQEAADLLEASTSKVAETATSLNLKSIDFAKAHVDASFELARKLLQTRDVSEAMELQMEFARKQAETCSAQAKEFGKLASKAAEEAGKPLTSQMTRSFEQFRSAFTV